MASAMLPPYVSGATRFRLFGAVIGESRGLPVLILRACGPLQSRGSLGDVPPPENSRGSVGRVRGPLDAGVELPGIALRHEMYSCFARSPYWRLTPHLERA